MDWTKESIHETVEAQRRFFRTGATLDVPFRIDALKKLKAALLERQAALTEALRLDLGRSETESYFCDIGSSLVEINEAIRHLRRWARPETRFSGLMLFPSAVTKVYKLPYGVSLLISPFNFPILLTLAPLIASIAGGNTAVIKASAKSPHCTAALRELIAAVFPPDYVTVVDGGHEVGDLLLAERFDKIFYTGSPRVGRQVLRAAAENLSSTALELGGENGNWCVVRADADLRDAARKIAFFKLCNSGQICININQVAVAQEVAEDFLHELKAAFGRQIGDALANPEYPRLVNRAAYDKCAARAEKYAARVVFGGHGDAETFKFEPTIFYPVAIDEELVQQELFSPLLPVVPFPDAQVEELMETIAAREHGLALYLFTKDLAWAKKTMASRQYGGGCINEVCLQLMVKGAPFNGVGHSGLGAYHGVWGFREFTHPSTVLIGSPRLNLPLREHPYETKRWKLPLLKLFMR